MKIFMTGASGFVGTHLRDEFTRQGHVVITAGRADLAHGSDHLANRMSGCDVVINLAGAPINRRWTSAYKQEIIRSRVETTRLLVEAMSQLDNKPATFISTSAIGAFDSAHRYTESDPANADDFLGRLSKQWEAAANQAQELGIRTIVLRFGLVLGHDGGLMKQLLTPFRMGLGGPIANGQQHFSWIHIHDLANIYNHLLSKQELSGVFHACAPHPVTNETFTRTLARALHRPAPFRVPELFLKLAFGEGAQVMTSGQCVVSERLSDSGFRFRYPALDSAIPSIVKKTRGLSPLNQLFRSPLKSSN
jgi:uncharacterized protein (TIGR01777 family)